MTKYLSLYENCVSAMLMTWVRPGKLADTALLLVNRQVGSEAAKQLYGSNIFAFVSLFKFYNNNNVVWSPMLEW
jgi:hypothetical protein